MYFLQGLLVGLATFAPIGMQNLFIINTALVQPLPRFLLTITIIGLFDMTLSTAAFYGFGALLEAWPVFNLIILIACGLPHVTRSAINRIFLMGMFVSTFLSEGVVLNVLYPT